MMTNQNNFPEYGKKIKLKNKWRGWLYGTISEKYFVNSRTVYTVDFSPKQYSNFFKEEIEIL